MHGCVAQEESAEAERTDNSDQWGGGFQVSRIKSLEDRLKSAATVHDKIDLLNMLAWELRDANRKRGKQLAETACDLAHSEQYQKGIADSLISLCQFDYTDYLSTLSHSLNALEIFRQLNDRIGQSRTLFTLCWAYWGLDNFTEAIKAGLQAQELAREIDDQEFEADLSNNLGLAYKRSGNYELGYKAYITALSISRSLGDQVRQSKALNNIALAYICQEKYEKALAYAKECQKLVVEDAVLNGYTLLGLGRAYAGLKQSKFALDYLQKALQIGRTHENSLLSIDALHTIGEVFYALHQPEKAVDHLLQAIALAEKTNTDLYAFQGHETLSKIYEDQAELNLAFKHYKKFHAIKERVFNDKNASRLQSLEVLHQVEAARREAEISQLRNIELEYEILERERTKKKLQRLAITDELTGLYNRRHFMDKAEYEIQRAIRANSHLAIVVIDIDRFKSINDTYGHAGGDQALVICSRIFKENIREIDLVSRFGGDEFTILLPNAERFLAIKIMERIRAKIASPICIGQTPLVLNISAGIACLNSQHDTVDSLLDRADQALYQAKSAGRDRICSE